MTKHDKYRVVQKIAAGGMAEVFQGIAESIEGFSKKVAIKRVLPHLAENKKFLSMFLDEARLSLRMNHANVVQVFDIGKAGETYFIVMEFVDGIDIKQLMEIMRVRKQRIPIEQAVFIIMEVCRGLAYAHDMTDGNGRNQGIVHRDVSPPNILLSKQGEVKLVDFGLAKATSQLEHTDPGVVKGKFAYLSPEAAWGKSVDRRADIFACGIVLFELLTGKRLFLGANDVKTVELVRLGDVPYIPAINPDVMPQLDAIVHKALAQNPNERYQSCDHLAEDLASYLFSQQRKVTSFDIRRLVTEIVSEQQRRPQTVPKKSIIDQLIQNELGRFYSLDDEDIKNANSQNRSPVIATGGQPLDHMVFEDPRTWESELQIDGTNSPLPMGQAGEWRESGLFKRAELSNPAGKLPTHIPPQAGPVSLAHMLEGEVRVVSTVPPKYDSDKKKFFQGLFITIAIAALGIGAAVALGWIP